MWRERPYAQILDASAKDDVRGGCALSRAVLWYDIRAAQGQAADAYSKEARKKEPNKEESEKEKRSPAVVRQLLFMLSHSPRPADD